MQGDAEIRCLRPGGSSCCRPSVRKQFISPQYSSSVEPFGLLPSLDNGELEARLRLAFRRLGASASPPLRYPYRKSNPQREEQKPEHQPPKREGGLVR